ncbi:MAG: response regulator [Myxococcota bacterium]
MADPIVALVADDHQDIRNVLGSVLRECGCEVHLAENGVQAVEMLELYPVDILLLDLQMPKMDGFGVLELVKKRAGKISSPLTLIVTANADVEGRIRGTELGAIDFVDKPFRVPAVRLRIERMMSMVQMGRGVDEAEASLAHLRARDPVTGAGTFAMLRSVLDAQFRSAQITNKPLSCLIVCDESYNALLGAEGKKAGESRLKVLAQAVHTALRGADLVFRIDAAELVVLLPGTSATGASRVIEKVTDALSESGTLFDSLFFATATYPHPQIAVANQLFRAANAALASIRSRDRERAAHFEGF